MGMGDELFPVVRMPPRKSTPVVIVTPERLAALEGEIERLRGLLDQLVKSPLPIARYASIAIRCGQSVTMECTKLIVRWCWPVLNWSPNRERRRVRRTSHEKGNGNDRTADIKQPLDALPARTGASPVRLLHGLA